MTVKQRCRISSAEKYAHFKQLSTKLSITRSKTARTPNKGIAGLSLSEKYRLLNGQSEKINLGVPAYVTMVLQAKSLSS